LVLELKSDPVVLLGAVLLVEEVGFASPLDVSVVRNEEDELPKYPVLVRVSQFVDVNAPQLGPPPTNKHDVRGG
jgi:hypothetical protein